MWSSAESGKAKRLRHTSRVTVPCDVRGRARGPAVEGVAELLDRDEWPGAPDRCAFIRIREA